MLAEATSVACIHCGLPVPAGLIEESRVEQFCCNGCSAAYKIIHANGLDSFYRMSEADQQKRSLQNTKASKTGFLEFDEPVFQSRFATVISESESKIVLQLEGIHCGACVWLLEKLPRILPGVLFAAVNWARRSITVQWRTEKVSLSTIALTIKQLGYSPTPMLQNERESRWRLENRKHLTRIGVAAACAGNNMIISSTLYLGMFSHMTEEMTQLMRIASCFVGLLALLWPGRVFLQSALGAIRTRTPHMDLPIALGLFVGTVAGAINVFRGTGEIYFDSLSVLIFLLLLGRWIQFRQQSKAANAVELLFQLTPQTTRKLINDKPIETLVDLVKVGDVLQIRAGDLFPVDGVITDGETKVDESILTGESELVTKKIGSPVAAGTKNDSTLVLMQAKKIGTETRLNRIVELVEQASLKKPKAVQWANQIGGVFVSAVLVLALFTFAWWMKLDAEVAIERTVALLIVACPCALALATPLAIAVAIGRAANQKIMVKGGDVLQSLQRPGTIWLDKTGTLTEGHLRVECWHGDTHWVDIVAALEQKFSHPVATALVEFARTNRLSFQSGNKNSTEKTLCSGAISSDAISSDAISLGAISNGNATAHPGMGASGVVGNHHVLAGNEKLLEEQGINVSAQHRRLANRILNDGFSPCWVVVDGQVVAIAAIGDSIRPEAIQAIDALKSRGWQVRILSGDHQEIVNRVARRLRIESKFAIGGVGPEEKLQRVSASNRESPNDCIVMVGDGVNDSAALAASTVGIAVKNGAEASLAAAPVYLAKPGLSPILELLSISDSTLNTMRINLAVSLGYNIAFTAAAFLGFINPLVAAILMPISSITVVAMSLRSGR